MGSTPKMIFLLLKNLNCRKQNNIQCNPLQESQPQIYLSIYAPAIHAEAPGFFRILHSQSYTGIRILL